MSWRETGGRGKGEKGRRGKEPGREVGRGRSDWGVKVWDRVLRRRDGVFKTW